MVFSSSVFLFFFLPIVLIGNFLIFRKREQKNIFLTVMSLLFYAWGEPWFVFVMLFSIAVNWLCGLSIEKNSNDARAKKRIITLGVIFNILLLAVFKYLMLLLNTANDIFSLSIAVPRIILPIGISFFTFQALSYIIDVYRGNGQAQKSFMNVCLYISFFPQLIAGPIVRYQTVADEITNRVETRQDFEDGARRFILGLAKKSLMANNLALLADSAFALPINEMSFVSGWLGAIAYLWQVYFDFSGYSDMAIGLGKMFGFHFLENFDFPMISRSITEFWRRWHISLGTWFRDYLFFPMGGSRVKSKFRAIFNMFVVWSLTGLWHGAGWNFALWGVCFFAFLAVEKYMGISKWMTKHWIGHIYAMAVITVITVFIRAGNMDYALGMIKTMFGFAGNGFIDDNAIMYLREYGWYVVIALVVALPIGEYIQKWTRLPDQAMQIIRGAGLILALFACVASVVMGGYNPFIYFNF